MNKQVFTIDGMHCEACTKLTAKRLQAIKNVMSTSVNLKTHTAVVQSEKYISLAAVNDVLANTPYHAEVYDEKNA